MKKKFLFTLLLLATVLPTALSAQDDADLQFENAEYVIRCVPSQSQTRWGKVADPMAWPADAAFDMGTPTPMDDAYGIDSKQLKYMRYEVLFTIDPTSLNAAAKTGNVALGASYKYTGDKGLSATYNYGSKCMITKFNMNYVPDYQHPYKGQPTYDAETLIANVYVPSQIYVRTGTYEGYTFTVTELSDDAFRLWSPNANSTLSSINLYLPETITRIGNDALGSNALSPLENLHFYKVKDDGSPDRDSNSQLIVGSEYNKVKTIGDRAFFGKSKLTTMPIGSLTTTLGSSVFQNCSGLVQNGTIDLSGATSLTALPDGMFEGFYELEALNIPSNITTVGAIWGTEVNYGVAPNYNAYLSDGRTSFTLTGMENVTHLDLRAFHRPGIKHIVLPSTVTTITHEYPFTESYYRDNIFLESIDFSQNAHITTLPEKSFEGCHALKTITWGTTLTTIGDRAFGRTGLESLTLPANITTVGTGAFQNCDSLLSANLSAATNLTTLSESMFYDCDTLATVQVPAALTTIGNNCFAEDESLTSLSFLSNTQLTTIGEGAFEHSGINAIDGMPATLERIEADAFSRCALKGEFNLNAQPWKSNIQYIGKDAFADNGLEYLKLNAAADYHAALQIHNGAFAFQRSEFTAEFDEACTTVPDYIKGCPFGVNYRGYTDANGDMQPNCMRVIVPIGSVTNYYNHAHMGLISGSDYRVKFRWGTFTDAQLKADSTKVLDQRSYYNLLNITPQQRLIATSAWKNDILNFRPMIIAKNERGQDIKGKATDFDGDAMPMPSAGSKPWKAIDLPKGGMYSNTVDYWDETNKKAAYLPYNEDFFNADQFAFNVADNDALAAFKSSATAKLDASYPQSLMPYTIHSFHSNHGNEEVEQIGRKAVTDGIVPYGTGIIIDFPRPGYYLVPPVAMRGEMSDQRRVYPVDPNGTLMTPDWLHTSDISMPFWWDRRNPVVLGEEPSVEEGWYMVSYEELEQLETLCPNVFSTSNYDSSELKVNVGEIQQLSLTAEQTTALSTLLATWEGTGRVFTDWDEFDNTYEYRYIEETGDGYYVKNGETTQYKMVFGDRYAFVNGEDETINMFEDHIMLRIAMGVITVLDVGNDVPAFTMNGTRYTILMRGLNYYYVYTAVSESDNVPPIDFAQLIRDNLDDRTLFNVELLSERQLSDKISRVEDPVWVDIDEPFTDYGQLYADFTANHNPDTDHNVIIGLPDSYPIFPYWAESPYPFQDAAHDAVHANLSDRFVINNAGDELNPLNFRYARYGRMGKGAVVSGDANPSDYGTFVNMKHVEAGTDNLDNDIHYVNFVVSKGYFVQVNTNPLVAGNGYSEAQWRDYAWTKPNRAYFSVSRAHLPHIFNSSNDGKLAIFIIPENGGETTAIGQPTTTQRPTANDWYTLQGVRLTQKPTQPGIYIHNGRKEVVK